MKEMNGGNAADDLYSIIDGKGSAKEVEAYNNTISEIAFLLNEKEPTTDTTNASLGEGQASMLKLVSWAKAMHVELPLSEIALYLEISGSTSYSQIRNEYRINKILFDFLSSPRASRELKIGVAYCHYDRMSPASWLCTADEGSNLTLALELCSFQEEGNKLRTTMLQRILTQAAYYNSTEDDPEGAQLIASLSPEIVNIEMVTAMLYALIDDSTSEPVLSAVMAHVRKVYDFDDDVPNEWVLRAIK